MVAERTEAAPTAVTARRAATAKLNLVPRRPAEDIAPLADLIALLAAEAAVVVADRTEEAVLMAAVAVTANRMMHWLREPLRERF
jgi:hypothetical protein